jgi:site-specific DNA-methyltransferase (adenine-specific)
VWQQALRVLKPGGHLLAFSGSRTYHRMVVAIEDAGFEIRDQIMWIYGSGFPKSLDVAKAIDKQSGYQGKVVGTEVVDIGIQGGSMHAGRGTKLQERERKELSPEAQQWQGWGTALKPAHEPIVVARKPLIGTVTENVLEHGVGGLNIDGCRIAGEVPSKPQPILGNKERVTYGGGLGRNGEMSQSSLGRWPANIIFDEQAAELLDEQSGISKSQGGRIGKKETSNIDFGLSGKYEKGDPGFGDTGGASRFFYCAKASKRDRNDGLDDFETKQTVGGGGLGNPVSGAYGSEKAPGKNFHPTVKPTSLMRYLVRLVTPPDGLVLDPFMGSGSTGKACALEHFDFVGIELNAEYIKICEARIENALQDKEHQQELF